MALNILEFLEKNYKIISEYLSQDSTYNTELNFDHFWGRYYWWIVTATGLAIILFFLIIITVNININKDG